MIFSVENRHGGTPPAWTSAPREANEIRSYFENGHGDQWVASASPDRLLVSCGDANWKTVRVDSPDYQSLAQVVDDNSEPVAHFQGLVLRTDERLWLGAVLLAAGRPAR